MSQFADFYQLIAKSPLSHWLNTLPAQLSEWEHISLHGKFTQWFNAVEKLPTLTPERLDLLHGVSADSHPPLPVGQQAGIESLLRQLMPWRKGPFRFMASLSTPNGALTGNGNAWCRISRRWPAGLSWM